MNPLHLSNQLCFPFYAISKEISKRYRTILAPFNLTYPQYLVMLVLWEQDRIPLKAIGRRLQLDSGTLTPLLNKLIQSGYIEKARNELDERELVIKLTDAGHSLREQAASIPLQIQRVLGLTDDEYKRYKGMLDELSQKLNM
ncbi:MarR family winged helix-turn-helix transcriptional regulator [Paenisporosarcina sp. OV554]|uniref:MarR family winged helix-turn-helix transcriptional regulator n=1 Tax=Paenisporosarcina sp. OV554 TaxID=2135694 RepID=UPI000D34A044|nr:MarR family transcriptional regulator [Paenisporosarcina sp. OV554]PUB10950.1 MarR family transcriptional regulator [Paenisporosarcina sp. OV554]